MSNLKAMKFKINSPEHSRQIQEKLFKLGYFWGMSGKMVQYTDRPALYANYFGDKTLTHSHTLEDFEDVGDFNCVEYFLVNGKFITADEYFVYPKTTFTAGMNLYDPKDKTTYEPLPECSEETYEEVVNGVSVRIPLKYKHPKTEADAAAKESFIKCIPSTYGAGGGGKGTGSLKFVVPENISQVNVDVIQTPTITPRVEFLRQRVSEVLAAMTRFNDLKMVPPSEWIEELEEIFMEIRNHA